MLTIKFSNDASPDKVLELTNLHDVSEAVEMLRVELLFVYTESDEGAGMDRYAEQHFLLALSLLEQAQRHLKIGWMEQLSKR